MEHRTKLLLLIPHLGGGGAEQVTAHLARRLDPQRFEIHLCLIGKNHPGAKLIPRWVQIHRFDRRRVRQAWFQLIRLIRAEKPDVILSGMAHLNFLVLLLKPWFPRGTCVLVRQNTTASAAAQTWLSRLAYRHLYRRADAVLCQSEAMAQDLVNSFGLPPSRLKVFANPIDIQAIQAACVSRHEDTQVNTWPHLLSAGRLAKEKGIDLLLHALHEVQQQHPQVHLTILGAGPEEAALKQLSTELSLENAVSFSGYRENLTDFYAQATLFVLPSRYEGMPNALLEAAAAGLPLAATPCSAGLCDLLHDAPGTWVAQAISANSLARTILAALATLTNPPPAGKDRQEPPQRFHHAFLAPFEAGNAISAYAAFIERSAAQARP
jgi:glycosyltransferase involved in cell wall biosynthesis